MSSTHPHSQEKPHMFRKIALALATTAALGAAALAPNAASAHPIGLGGGHGPVFHGPIGHSPVFHGPVGHGPHFVGPHGRRWPWGVGIAAGVVGGAVAVDACYRREVINTPYGPEVRWVNVCW
jgi:hypothetical protein